MSRGPIITNAEAAGLVALYRSGLTLHQIAAQFGRSPSGVRRILVKSGVEMRPSGPRDTGTLLPSAPWHPDLPDAAECRRRLNRLQPRQRAVIELMARGWSSQEIARHLGVTLKTVHNHLCAAADTLAVRPPRPMVVAMYHRACEATDDGVSATDLLHELRNLRAS